MLVDFVCEKVGFGLGHYTDISKIGPEISVGSVVFAGNSP